MKIERLIGIVSILLQCDAVTAPQLAEKFEVSRRTIQRDIDALCRAGIPICTRQGQNGGISIMENYRIDRTVLTSGEMREILAGLRSLDSVSGERQYGRLMEKLQAGSSDFMSGDQSILIDLSSWYKDSLAPKISVIREAVDGKYLVEFDYFAPKGESRRQVEPYFLIFRWSSWYLWGWCTDRKDFRLFKLNRMENVKASGDHFTGRQVPAPDLSNEHIFPGGTEAAVLFAPECKWRLVEEFGMGCLTEQPDGNLLFEISYMDKDSLISWLLTFREKAILIRPQEIKEEIREILEKMQNSYRERGNNGLPKTDKGKH